MLLRMLVLRVGAHARFLVRKRIQYAQTLAAEENRMKAAQSNGACRLFEAGALRGDEFNLNRRFLLIVRES